MANVCSSNPSTAEGGDCTKPLGLDSTSKAHFLFTSLWNYTQKIQSACPNDPRLFLKDQSFTGAHKASLTQKACVEFAGSSWTLYPAPDIWNRLTTWKFPLLQLVASFPRPPLNWKVECMVILHLLGDPIDTMRNLLLKMSSCQNTAQYWKTQCETLLSDDADGDKGSSDRSMDSDWKSLAIVTDAYEEWGEGSSARAVLYETLKAFSVNQKARNDLMMVVRLTGHALAADRSTKFLPIIVAQSFFIGAVGIAIGRTASAARTKALSDTVFINVEAHSIAFSALYFWIIPAVFLSSIIGVSQTEEAVPRILRRFQTDVDRLLLPRKVQMPENCLTDKERRIFSGGVYSWQPSTWQSRRHSSFKPFDSAHQPSANSRYKPLSHHLATASDLENGSTLERFPAVRVSTKSHWVIHELLPYMVLILGTMTGNTVSSLVPPDGFNCRNIGELLICTAWLLSVWVDSFLNRICPPRSQGLKTLFRLTTLKDFLMTVATMGGIIVTQIGIFNRCSCYTNWGRTGLTLPERADVAATLYHRLSTIYPAITFTSICLHLIIVPLIVCFWYRDALRVFTQRDNRESNAAWFWAVRRKVRTMGQRMRSTFSCRQSRRSKVSIKGNLDLEQGLMHTDERFQVQPLTPWVSPEPEAQLFPATAVYADNRHRESMTSESSSMDLPLPSRADLPVSEPPLRQTTEPPLGVQGNLQRTHVLHRKPVLTAASVHGTTQNPS